MSDDLAPYTVDTRGGVKKEVLVYRLETDKWGKPYYTPSAFPPLTADEARVLGQALLDAADG